jgi:hypothetical protein
VKKVIPTTRHGAQVLLVASQLPGVFITAAIVAALPRVVVIPGPVVVPAAAAAAAAVPAAATAVVPAAILAAAGPDGLHVAARLPGVAVAVASAARSVII